MVPDESGKFPQVLRRQCFRVVDVFLGVGWSNLDLGRTHFDDPKLEVMF